MNAEMLAIELRRQVAEGQQLVAAAELMQTEADVEQVKERFEPWHQNSRRLVESVAGSEEGRRYWSHGPTYQEFGWQSVVQHLPSRLRSLVAFLEGLLEQQSLWAAVRNTPSASPAAELSPARAGLLRSAQRWAGEVLDLAVKKVVIALLVSAALALLAWLRLSQGWLEAMR